MGASIHSYRLNWNFCFLFKKVQHAIFFLLKSHFVNNRRAYIKMLNALSSSISKTHVSSKPSKWTGIYWQIQVYKHKLTDKRNRLQSIRLDFRGLLKRTTTNIQYSWAWTWTKCQTRSFCLLQFTKLAIVSSAKTPWQHWTTFVFFYNRIL